MADSLFDIPKSPRFVAHRGFTPAAPENSLPAFETAAKLGFWAVETDVHLTRDGVPVCCHDPDTAGMFNEKLLIAGSTFAELRKLHITQGNRAKELPEESLRLPAFTEYLDICERYGAIPFIESKTPAIGRIVAELNRRNLTCFSVLSSIDITHLEECRRLNRNIFIHHIFSTPETRLQIAEFGNGGVSCNYPDPFQTPPGLIETIHSRNLRVCLRAADTPAHLRKMQELQLDYIPTNQLYPCSISQK